MPRIFMNEWPPYAPPDQARRESALQAAKLMMNAAFTAPVAGGVPQLEGEIVYGYEEQEALARKMEELGNEREQPLWRNMFKTEAVMVRESDAILFIGNYRNAQSPFDAGCGLCAGRADCSFVYENRPVEAGQIDYTARKPTNGRLVDGPLCSMHVDDQGYAVAGALWIATRLCVDARPLMSVGVAGQKLGYCPNSAMVVGIPIACLSKNSFVDVNPHYHVINMAKVVDNVRKHFIILRQFSPNYRTWHPYHEEK